MARIRQARGTTCTNTTTVPRGGSCRDSCYLNDRRDRAWRPCQVIEENKLTWEVFCLALGLDLHSMVEKSRAMFRATRVDDVFDMLCPNQKTRDVLTISTLGLLIVQICWTILKKKKLDQWRGRILFDAFIVHCVRLGENDNDFVERLLDEGASTECSGTGERCVHLETALAAPHSCSGCAPYDLAFWKRLARCILSASNVVMSLRGALRAMKETVDDNVLTLAGLSSDPLKEKHLATKSGRRRTLCVDYKKALTSELAAKRMKTRNQLARIDGVDTKRMRETLSKEMLAYQCYGFHIFHDLRGVFSCSENGTRMVRACHGEDRPPCYTRRYE